MASCSSRFVKTCVWLNIYIYIYILNLDLLLWFKSSIISFIWTVHFKSRQQIKKKENETLVDVKRFGVAEPTLWLQGGSPSPIAGLGVVPPPQTTFFFIFNPMLIGAVTIIKKHMALLKFRSK
jgi:hypothetical protein